MNRMIDADALITDCQLAQKQADRHGREYANAFYSGGGEISAEWWCVEDMIENAPTIEERKWIPCSERLPKPFEHCLWTTTDGRVVYHHCDGLFSNYTAWMPLPEPYAERRADGHEREN